MKSLNMPPTIFADKETSHTRKKQTRNRQMRHRISAETRNVARYHNSPVMTTINNYGTLLKAATRSSTNKTKVKFSEDNLAEQMDTDDEEVNEIISSQKHTRWNEIFELQSNCKKSNNHHPHKFDSKQKNLAEIKPIAVFSTRSLTNDRQSNLIKPSSPSIKIGTVAEQTAKTTYADICEIKNAEGLLTIALKTIKLIKRNQLLQRRLSQLQMETSHFIASVLANPENRQVYDKS